MTDLWRYNTMHNCICKVIEEQVFWGETACRVWLPTSDAVVKIPGSALVPINQEVDPEIEQHSISYIAMAAKVAEVLENSVNAQDGHILLAPMESNVIPLPHQLNALSRSISGDRIRYLLADEVGLGKTIEAGLILRELKLRGLVKRILVVAPKGIATQWISEMQIHFNEKFQLILGEDLETLKRISENLNTTHWRMFHQVVVSLDSIKPVEKRRGWSKERIAEYNKARFEDIITSGWDLIIVDEAHRLAGSTDQVARYKLGQGLAEAAPYLLLLSATPHQGKSDAFHRLVSLLDADTFPDQQSISRDRVGPFVIRTEKRKAIDDKGQPLFKPRRTEMVPISWEEKHHLQEHLYKSVTEYVREGYNQAIREKKYHIGFLMILMQRLMVSSTKAIRATLEKRLNILKGTTDEHEDLLNDENEQISLESWLESDEWQDLDGQEQIEFLLRKRITALKNEQSEVQSLLDLAVRCEQAGADAKAENLIDLIYKLQAEENEPDLKALIFTEFIPTQEMLRDFLEARGISVVCLNGSLSMDERKDVQDQFRNNVRVLISTDAGGEGLNLQFCHVVINYDIPWNPMRLEQRIGRVDRIGQPKVVRALNFVFENSVEYRVREVLEHKLSVIFKEFGIDKTGDVLDSAQAGEIFEDIFTDALVNPDGIEEKIETTLKTIEKEIKQTREESTIYNISDEPDVNIAQQLRTHPLPYWLERMTVSYLQSHGGGANRKRNWWELNWPDGTTDNRVVFNAHDAERHNAYLLNLEDSRIRGVVLSLSPVIPCQPVMCVHIKDLPENISGYWGLFEIRVSISSGESLKYLRIPYYRRRFISVFSTEDGKVFLPTARHIWNVMNDSNPIIKGTLSKEDAKFAYEWLMDVAKDTGTDIFNELKQEHLNSIKKEEERANYLFEYKRKANALVGLPEVRNYRNNKLKEEETTWQRELSQSKQIIPEIRPLIVFKVEKGEDNG